MSDAAVERRVLAELGPDEGGRVIAFAHAMMAAGSLNEGRSARTEKPPVAIPVTKTDAAQAGGADLIRRTLLASARPDEPDIHTKAEEVIAALKSMAPRTAVEGGLAGLFVAMERAAFDCLSIARLAGFDSPLGMTMLGRAEKLACRAVEASEAIARPRNGGKQTIVVQHIRAAQAVGIGVVAKGETR
jgi:hypothetical protein